MIQLNNDLTTKALKSIESVDFEQSMRKRATMSFPSGSSMLSSSTETKRSVPLKRSRSRSALAGSFDMGDFLKASQQVEDTIAFPAIEWPSFDDDDISSSDDDNNSAASSLTRQRQVGEDLDDDDDEDFFHQSPRKRPCRGLTRCDRSGNLTSLWELAIRSERHGSNGSLS